MTSSWSEHLVWVDDTELARLMRQRENTGRPLGDTDFVKQMGNLLSRDLLPKKNVKERKRERTPNLFVFVGIDKFVGCDACLSDCAAQRSDGKFLVGGDNTTFILFAKDNMAAALSYDRKAKRFENLDCFGSGDSWQFRHEQESRRWSG